MATGATALVTYDGNDITSNVLFESATFTTVARGEPGQFEFRVKDPGSSLSFATGKEVTFSLNGTKVFGGYIMQIGRTFAFPDKTTGSRIWVLRGTDYNILFDKRVLRNEADYLSHLPKVPATKMDGAAIKYAIEGYTDLAELYTDTIDNVDYYNNDGVTVGAYPQQGSTVRELMTDPAFKSGAVYYISADKHLHYHGLESSVALWGFSDDPDRVNTFPMHEVDVTEDGSLMVNDALIWGGSQFAGSKGGTVFSRVQSPSSISAHGRWQHAEANFGGEGFGTYAQVNARAKAIINGPGGTDIYNQQKGLMYPQWAISATWWLHDVPSLPVPGYLYTIELTGFGVTKVLPLRTMTMTFPELAPDGKAYVQMRGEFSLNVHDSYSIWSYLRSNSKKIVTAVVSSTDDDSTSTVYGAYGSFTNITSQGGLVYKLPFGYIPNTLMVYAGGLAISPKTGFTETDNVAGTFTLASAPAGALYATCRTLHT